MQVWILLLITLAIVPLALSALMKYQPNFRQTRQADASDPSAPTTFKSFLFKNAMYVFNIITGQGNKFQTFNCLNLDLESFELFPGDNLSSRRLAVIVSAGTWCLMSVVLVYSYTGNLTSYLASPKLNRIPNSFEDVVKMTEYKFAAFRGQVVTDIILVTPWQCNT